MCFGYWDADEGFVDENGDPVDRVAYYLPLPNTPKLPQLERIDWSKWGQQ